MIAVEKTFSALGDPTRRAIVQRLAVSEATVSELAKPFSISLPAISKHLRILEEADLLIRVKEGRTHRCQLNPKPLQQAKQWIERYTAFWNAQLDSLDIYLQSSSSQSPTKEFNKWNK